MTKKLVSLLAKCGWIDDKNLGQFSSTLLTYLFQKSGRTFQTFGGSIVYLFFATLNLFYIEHTTAIKSVRIFFKVTPGQELWHMRAFYFYANYMIKEDILQIWWYSALVDLTNEYIDLEVPICYMSCAYSIQKFLFVRVLISF